MQRTHNQGLMQILATHHDVSEAAFYLSADIAKVLYPFLCMKAVNAHARVAFWREYVLWADVPLPLMSFLEAKFGDTNWRFVFLRGSHDQVSDVKKIYHSMKVAIPRKVREPQQQENELTTLQETLGDAAQLSARVQGVQSASLPSPSTMESAAATMHDRGS